MLEFSNMKFSLVHSLEHVAFHPCFFSLLGRGYVTLRYGVWLVEGNCKFVWIVWSVFFGSGF